MLEATAKNQGVWSAAALRHANLLDKTALNLLNENVRTGNENRNSKISDLQKELLDTLQGLVGRDTASTAAAVALLEKHVQPWTARGHWAVAEELYAALARTLPEDARWTMEIKEIELGVAQVKQEHQSLATGGLSIPRKLDPRLQKALLRCYALQAGLEANSPRLKQVRGVWEGIVAYYRGLEYDDVAEAAIKTKPEQAVAAADQFAAFTLLVLQEDRARREVVRLGHRYGAAENLTLTPAVRAVLDGWQKFLTENPGSPLVPDVVGRVLGIASFFEQQKAAQIAADVYGELSKTASGIKALAQAAPGSASTADRAAFLRAVALDTQARKVLALALAEAPRSHASADPAEQGIRNGPHRLYRVRRGAPGHAPGGRGHGQGAGHRHGVRPARCLGSDRCGFRRTVAVETAHPPAGASGVRPRSGPGRTGYSGPRPAGHAGPDDGRTPRPRRHEGDSSQTNSGCSRR